MNRPTRLLACTLSIVLLGFGPTIAGDWLRFRGPDGAGKSAERVPTEWSESKNLAWRVELPGQGSSSPIVVGDRVIVTTFTGGGNDLVRQLVCLHAATGEEQWRRAVPASTPEDPYQGFLKDHGYATSTPVSDGERIYAFFGKSGVHAFDLKGEPLWRTSVGTESSSRRWGSGASLVLHGDHVIVNASEESQSIRALDRATGREVWKAEAGSLELVYNTPLVVTPPEGKAEIVVSVPNEVWGLHADTGKLKWYAENDIAGNVTPSLVTDGKVVYALGGRPAGSAAVRIGGRGDVTDSHTVWTSRTSSYVPSPVLHEGRLYWVDDNGTATCVEAATGELVYRERLDLRNGGGRAVYASVLLVGGNIHAMTRRNGTIVYAAGPEFREIARNVIGGDDTDFNASPAVANGRLYLRSNQAIYCIESDSASDAERP